MPQLFNSFLKWKRFKYFLHLSVPAAYEKNGCGLCLVPRGWGDAHGSLLLSKDPFVLPSPRGTCPMRGNDSFCYHADLSVSVTITPFSKKHYFSWLSASWKMWPLKPGGGDEGWRGDNECPGDTAAKWRVVGRSVTQREGQNAAYVHTERKRGASWEGEGPSHNVWGNEGSGGRWGTR